MFRLRLLKLLLLGLIVTPSVAKVKQLSAAEKLWLDAARASITSHELHSHVGVLADDTLEGREAGTRGGHAAARYLIKRLETAGLQPAGSSGDFVQRFHGRSQNILAKIEGTDPQLQNEVVVLGAHYDHVGYGNSRNSYGPWGFIHNGADDNASGVATLLEVIDALVHTGYQPRRTLLFAFWDGEEKGLLGSKHWVRNPTMPLDSVKLAINVDMVGRLRDGQIQVLGTRSGKGLRQLMSTDRVSGDTWIDFTWDFKDNSDHWTFFDSQIPSLCIHTGVHDDYHRPSDDVEKINFEGMQEVTRYLLEQLCELTDADQLPTFRTAARRETPESQKKSEVILPPIASRLDFTWRAVPTEPDKVVVEKLMQGGNAEKAGLAIGDRIIAVDGHSLTKKSLLPALALAGESEFLLKIERPDTPEPIELALPLNGKQIRLGLSWRTDDAEPDAVYITRVIPDSPAARAELKVYDRIYALNGENFQGQQELFSRVKQVMSDGASELLFQVESRGILREVAVSLDLLGEQMDDATL